MLNNINSRIYQNTEIFQAITNEQAACTSGGLMEINVPNLLGVAVDIPIISSFLQAIGVVSE